MNPQMIILALTLIETAANTAVALTKFKSIVQVARDEGRDISLTELRTLQDENHSKLAEVLALIKSGE